MFVHLEFRSLGWSGDDRVLGWPTYSYLQTFSCQAKIIQRKLNQDKGIKIKEN